MARTVKRWLVLLAAVSLLLANAVPAAASSAPYESYNYNSWRSRSFPGCLSAQANHLGQRFGHWGIQGSQ